MYVYDVIPNSPFLDYKTCIKTSNENLDVILGTQRAG